MLVTKKYIKELREKSFIDIPKEEEALILAEFGQYHEPDENGHVYIYTEQDIWEQIRKMIKALNK